LTPAWSRVGVIMGGTGGSETLTDQLGSVIFIKEVK
jgi:hypothetical protein